MDSDMAGKLVFAGTAVELAVVLAAARRGNHDAEETYRSLWAIGILTLALSALADFAPQVVGPFAVLVAVAMVARNPGRFGEWLGFEGAGPLPVIPSARPEEGSRGGSTSAGRGRPDEGTRGAGH